MVRLLLRMKNAAIAMIAITTPAIPTPIPILAPLPKPLEVIETIDFEGLGVDDAGLGVVEAVVEIVLEGGVLDAKLEVDVEELVDENPIVAAITTPCFSLQHVALTPPQHHDPSLHWPTGTLSDASPPF